MIWRTPIIDGNQRYSWTKTRRSLLVSRALPRHVRPSTISCWRRTAFSASSRAVDLNGETKRAKANHRSPITRSAYAIRPPPQWNEVFGTHISPPDERVWGKAPASILANFERWQNTIHSGDRDRVLAGVQRVRAGESTVQRYRIVRPDGSVRRIRDTMFPIRDGHVQRIGGIAQDVTKDGGSTIYLVAPDKASRSRLALLLESAGYTVKVFRSASSFLDMAPVLAIGSVIAQVENSQGEGLTIPKDLRYAASACR